MPGSTWGEKKENHPQLHLSFQESLDIKPLHRKLLEIQGFPYKYLHLSFLASSGSCKEVH